MDHLEEALFRRESGRIVAALVRLFGVHRLALAEDVTQDAFARAIELWKADGVPQQPGAWLMLTAKRRALDALRRERTADTFAPLVAHEREDVEPLLDEAFEEHAIRDEQLRMMFSCCHPSLAEEAQVALILNILCGFGAPEIASAFLVGRAAVEKRISRGKKTLAAASGLFALDDADFAARLSAVRRALYLLFNEGYHAASGDAAVRRELCRDALHLVALLLDHEPAATPETCALAALMALHAARLPARVDAAGDLNPLAEQDRGLWDRGLLADGFALLERAGRGDRFSALHVEAAIAGVHAAAPSLRETDWNAVVELYDMLLRIAPSPVVALNRAIAIGERDGAEEGLDALRAIVGVEAFVRYPFHAAAMGELELRRGNAIAAAAHFGEARAVARSQAERRFLDRRIEAARAMSA